MILGIDEVGRGVWAGPLVVGAVVLGDAQIDGLTDSKALSKKKREALDVEIRANAAAIGLGWVSADEIDNIGLSEALRVATKRAVQEVQASGAPFHEIIIDGTINFLSDTPLGDYVTTMKKADLLIASVSAASIVAKVARDAYMSEQDVHYPDYGFADHVGYGTAAHRQAIDRLGVTPLHRLSIAPLQKYAMVQGLTLHHDDARRARGEESVPRGSLAATTTTRQIGNASESAAARELERRGHEIIARNWKTKWCEIDIVSRKDDTYYFTEVKHRRNDTAGDGLAAITPKKLAQMRYAAKFYAHTEKLVNTNLRLLAIATASDPPRVLTITTVD